MGLLITMHKAERYVIWWGVGGTGCTPTSRVAWL